LAHSGTILAAVRNATAPSLTEESNTPPFTSGRWLFAHNGEVAGFASGGRRPLLQEVSDRRAAEIGGTADSEVLFAMVLDRIDGGASPSGALAGVVGAVMESTGGRLNMVLTDGHTVAATACGDSLYVQEDAPGFVVASEPYDDRPGWQEVPDGSVIETTEGGSPFRLRIGGMSR
jgi:glutamine amidotransferase